VAGRWRPGQVPDTAQPVGWQRQPAQGWSSGPPPESPGRIRRRPKRRLWLLVVLAVLLYNAFFGCLRSHQDVTPQLPTQLPGQVAPGP
jgi:hypothetical protein